MDINNPNSYFKKNNICKTDQEIIIQEILNTSFYHPELKHSSSLGDLLFKTQEISIDNVRYLLSSVDELTVCFLFLHNQFKWLF